METFALVPRGVFARAFGRNPLVRFSDRVETIAVLVAVVIALVGVPFAAAFGTSVHEQRAHAYAQLITDRHQVAAVATADSTTVPRAYTVEFSVPVTWRAGTATRAAVVRVDQPVKAGADVPIWCDRYGERTGPPPLPTQAGVDAVWTALVAWLVLCGLCALMVAVIRARLNRARDRAWDHDLRSLSGDGGRSGR